MTVLAHDRTTPVVAPLYPDSLTTQLLRTKYYNRVLLILTPAGPRGLTATSMETPASYTLQASDVPSAGPSCGVSSFTALRAETFSSIIDISTSILRSFCWSISSYC
jgi:hypothetical protein